MLYVAIWYVSIRPVVMRVKEELQFFLHILSGTLRGTVSLKFTSRSYVSVPASQSERSGFKT